MQFSLTCRGIAACLPDLSGLEVRSRVSRSGRVRCSLCHTEPLPPHAAACTRSPPSTPPCCVVPLLHWWVSGPGRAGWSRRGRLSHRPISTAAAAAVYQMECGVDPPAARCPDRLALIAAPPLVCRSVLGRGSAVQE